MIHYISHERSQFSRILHFQSSHQWIPVPEWGRFNYAGRAKDCGVRPSRDGDGANGSRGFLGLFTEKVAYIDKETTPFRHGNPLMAGLKV